MSSILLLVLSAFILTAGQLVDEMQQYEKECLGEDKFPCLSGGCISHEQYCDGKINCPDGSDEYFCIIAPPDPNNCNLTHHYLCQDGKRCIPNSWLCNNETDCEDGSDEKGCVFSVELYEAYNDTCKGFRCDGDKCISKLWVCDGIVDCDDKTDEYSQENCRNNHFPRAIEDVSFCQDILLFKDRNYRCIDSSFCLLKSMMCNGIVDCRDGSDEGHFCEKWDTMCTDENNPCKANDTQCIPERWGASCICTISPVMKQYNQTTQSCEDVDECALARPQCSHGCINQNGRFTCTCDEGYQLDGYKYLCYAKGPEALLFYTTNTEIKFIKIKSKQDVLLASGIKQVHGVSYDGKYVYWVQTAQGHQAIMRAELNNFQKTTKVLISLGLEDPGDIAVDWVGGHIYFSDIQRGTISACRTDGSVCVTLRTNSKQPRFVTLGMRYGKMFWADWHHRPLLMWAQLDGSKSSTLVDNLTSFATGLALDEPNGRLYFVDRTIKVVKLDDKQIYTLFEERLFHPYAVAVFENTVYWSDWISNSVQTTDKLHGSRQKRSLLVGLSTPIYGMHIYHPVLYNPTHNPCENHSCSHMCLASSNITKICMCPDGMELIGTNCQYIQDYKPVYLVIGGGSWFTRIEFNVLGNPENQATRFDIGRVQAMAYDSRRDSLYLYDGQRKTINYVSMKDFSKGITRTFMYKGLTDVVDMGYDYVTDVLYILDAGRGFVEAVSLRTRKRALLTRLEPEHVPFSLCLVPEHGRMLIVIMETDNNNEIHVDSIGLDGADRKTIITTNLKGPHVQARYDKVEDRVYITDDGNGVIDAIHPEGTGRENFRQISTTLISLAVAESHLFWTDRRPRLYWTNVHQATQNIRKLDFTMFPNNTQLFVQATFLPLNRNDSLYDHPCLVQLPCSDVCVQASHAPVPRSASRNSSLTPHTCHCHPGLLNVNGQCTPLAECKGDDIYCHRSNTCVSQGQYCNGVRDCTHGEDEESCESRTTTEAVKVCSEGQILCHGVCVEGNICSAGIDTTTTAPVPSSTESYSVVCSEIEYLCPNSSLCVDRARLCDGYKNCPGGHDESPEFCDTLTCHETEYMCTSGSCIFIGFKCDGESDCADGSDEVNCDDISCGISFYECRSKECIDLRKRCDGNQDCVDMSDEEDCETLDKEMDVMEPKCEDEEYACELNRSICLPPTARCNMKIDCPGGTDELGCDHRCGPRDMFECKQEYICILKSRVCNGHSDCLDGSDETPEACKTVNMTSRLYRPSQLPSSQCDEGYLCGNGQCIEWHEVCDGRTHCYDGSDENGRCNTSCVNVSCGLSCQPTPQGGQCRCARGTVAAADGRTCDDIDECARDPPVCAQRCENTFGSFLCACFDGYSLRPDHRTCKAINGDMTVVYSWDNTVWTVSTSGHSSIVYNDPKTASFTDIALDMRKHRLYVSLTAAGKLVEVNSTGTDEVVTNIGKPTKIAVEWITGNVYFVDNTPHEARMRVCNVWRKRCARLQKLQDNAEVTALAVDPAADRIFYCVSRGSSTVWSTSLAGYGLADLAPADNCTALAVDTSRRRLFLADAGALKITSMNYGGEMIKVEVSNETDLRGIHGLSVFEEHVYFITTNSLHVNRCTLFGKKHCEVVIHRAVGASAFVLRHDYLQRSETEDPCQHIECSNLCVLTVQSALCLCVDGTLAKNGVCPLFQKSELPLFNGWTSEQYERAQSAVYWVVGVGSLLLLLYVGVVVYYKYASRRNALNRHYMEVRFQNTQEEITDPASSVVEMPATPSAAIEFVNPVQFVRGVWDQMRQKRPIGTEGLDVQVPYEQHDVSDTESDFCDKDYTQMVH